MGRNKLSPKDKIKNEIEKVEKLLSLDNKENEQKIVKFLSTIRSKILKDLCYLSWARMENTNLLLENKKELGKVFGWGERRMYDFCKAIHFIEVCGHCSFQKTLDEFSKLMIDKQTTPMKINQINPR